MIKLIILSSELFTEMYQRVFQDLDKVTVGGVLIPSLKMIAFLLMVMLMKVLEHLIVVIWLINYFLYLIQ